MPTTARQPSLESTQAIGAVLLHQFARERFLEAGVNDEWINEAGNLDLDHLTAVILQEEEDKEEDDSTKSCDESSLPPEQSSAIEPEEVDTTLLQVSSNVSQTQQQSTTNGDDSSMNNNTQEFVSMIGNSTTILTNGPDSTIYHSINNGHNKSREEAQHYHVPSPLERLQKSPAMAHYGRELRKIADEFERSRLRQVVKQKADDICLQNISKETFIQLLEELFQGGITRERIVILFFFCTDVALRAVSYGSELVVKLIQWSFSYIIGTVCRIVHMIGGWEIEFSSANWQTLVFQQLPSILVSCCAALGIVALVSHLNKSLRA